jgi:hypothetical protein
VSKYAITTKKTTYTLSLPSINIENEKSGFSSKIPWGIEWNKFLRHLQSTHRKGMGFKI